MDFSYFNPTYSKTGYFNTKIKTYPNGKSVTYYCNSSIFHKASEESEELEKAIDDILDSFDDGDDLKMINLLSQTETDHEKNIMRCVRRAKERIFDIAFCNDWKYFITLTIDDNKLDSLDVKAVMKKLNKFLNNFQQRYGLSYMIIPEYHQNGRVHCHGLINDSLKVVDSGTRKVNGYDKPLKLSTIKAKGLMSDVTHVIYNLPQWSYGFSTAVPVYGDGGALATYVTKYMTKATTKIFGKYYWSSRDLVREPNISYSMVDYNDVDLPEFRVPNTGIKLKYESKVEFTKGDLDNEI